ncbi:MAG: D-tyrosyl-tRNA(Tyr) deacylase [Bacteroidales bacterium]|nr:D-tyrosyl-tRNA(Tyr) deacylase [Bacteroidales bacterium]
MKAVIQRVSSASVTIDGAVRSQIGPGLLVLLGVGHNDSREDIDWLVKKIAGLRIFNDEAGIMNLSVMDTGGDIIVVSQFTLMASTKKGNRPSYIAAAGHEKAIPLYEQFCASLSSAIGKPVGTGVFGADMKVALVNDGPVTICIDTKQKD